MMPSRLLPLLLLTTLGFAPVARAAEESWWSLDPPVRHAIPRITGAANPIDAFILQKLRDENLLPSPAADRRTLIRRLYLVMIGMPPTPEMVEEFAMDPAPDDEAWERAIDLVLGDSRYGERWALHWLDVIRWAETAGFETNAARSNAWPYRDWLIRSLNADKPYDRFIFEQLAGDTAGEDAALGFLVAGPANLPGQIGRDEEAMRQARQDELDEVIRTVSEAFLGITIGCARCHDHKFDPVTQRDYYAMQAIFAGLHYGERRLRGTANDEWTAGVPAAAAKVKSLSEKLETMRKALALGPPLADRQEENFPSIKTDAVRMLIGATADGKEASLYEFEIWSAASEGAAPENVALAKCGARASASSFALENQTRHPDNLIDGTTDERQAFPWKADKSGPAWIRIDLAAPATIDRILWQRGSSAPAAYEIEIRLPGGAWKTVAGARNRLPRMDDVRKARAVSLDGVSENETEQLVAMIAGLRAAQNEHARLAAGPQVFAAHFAEADPAWLLNRGDAMQRLDPVGPAVPEVLGTLELPDNFAEPERRLALARHLTDSAHPLTARVMVNRVWQNHFGSGLVETPSDFGEMGARPSHPELLDWLAIEFVENGWSLKHLHRLILTSKTFRQSSRPRPEAIRIDAESRLLWRFPPRRLAAETIRDSLLFVSGKLNDEMFGPGFNFFKQSGGLSGYDSHETFDSVGWRRMVYATKIRMQAVDIFGAFDCPDGGQMKPTRTRSVTPLQALSFMNSAFVNRQAAFFAARIQEETGDDTAPQVDRALRLAFSRPPSAEENRRLSALASEHGLEQVCRVLLNASEFVFLQ